MMGASNLWFASTQSIIVMPRSDAEKKDVLADRLRVELGVEQIMQFADQIDVIRALAGAKNIDVAGLSDGRCSRRGRRRARRLPSPTKSARESAPAGTRSNCSFPNGATCKSRRCSRSSRTPAG